MTLSTNRGVLEALAFFALGVVATLVGPAVGRASGIALGAFVPAALLAVCAGYHASQRSAWSWVVAVLAAPCGIAVTLLWHIAATLRRDPPAPDGGVAIAILVLVLVTAVPAFAAVVVITALLFRRRTA